MSHCMFCGDPGESPCDRERCREFDRELIESLDDFHAKDLKEAVSAAWRDRCKIDDNLVSEWSDWPKLVLRFVRWFYTAKCLICVHLLGPGRPDGLPHYPDVIEVGCHHNETWYGGWDARWIQVGRGVFTQWFAEIEVDGDSNM